MRTTIKLQDELLREAKGIAAATGKSLAEVVEDALRESFARRRASTARERVVLPTSTGFGLQPGVNLDNSAALLDLMEGIDAPS